MFAAKHNLERLFSRQEIGQAVERLAEELDRDYAGRAPHLMGVLRGAFIFLADLVREMRTPATIEFIRLSSYRTGTETSGRPRVVAGPPREVVEGRHVVVIEDIVDTGLTTLEIYRYLRRRRPASLALCALLDKPARRRVPVQIDYLGFTIPDAFVVGYGLDFAGQYRQLPDIYRLTPGEPSAP